MTKCRDNKDAHQFNNYCQRIFFLKTLGKYSVICHLSDGKVYNSENCYCFECRWLPINEKIERIEWKERGSSTFFIER